MGDKSKTGCYYPDGSPADGRFSERGIPILYPCSNVDPNKPHPVACCELDDACTNEKLCGRVDFNTGKIISLYRGGCTDPFNRSNFCPDKCTINDAPYFDPLNSTVQLSKCTRNDLQTFFVVCNDDGISERECSEDGQGISSGLTVDDRVGFMMNSAEANAIHGIAAISFSATDSATGSVTTSAPACATATSTDPATSLPNSFSADSNSITGHRLVAAISIPVTITVVVLMSCVVSFLLLRRRIKKENAESTQFQNNSQPAEPVIPINTVASPALFNPEGEGADRELDATSGSQPNRQELNPSPTTTLWPSAITHRPTSSLPSGGSPVFRFPPLVANPRPTSFSASHTLPALSPLSPLSPLDSEYYRSSNTVQEESVELPTERGYKPYKPPILHISEDGTVVGLSAPPRETRAMRRSSTAPGAIWSDHPHPLASNPPFDEPVNSMAASDAEEHQEGSAWEDRFTETGPAA
ncbi:hypothetical protein QBC43DRAFT_284912 [Cladorrhinum sp. PSN259]|nr:hypothetical protein QBC43DRAFT_284912 [Cladorrhinum sp. PSN259]